MRKNRNQLKKGIIYLLPGLLGMILFFVIPFFKSLSYTFTQGISNRHFVGLKNFKELFSNPVFQLAVKNTIIFLLLAVPILLIVSLTLSFCMLKKKHTFIRVALLLPMVIPGATLALGVQQIFGNYGWLNHILSIFKYKPVDFIQERGMMILLLLYFLKNIGYITVLLNSAMTTLSRGYEDAYRLDRNIGPLYLFRIILPLIMPMLFFVVLLAVSNTFRIYREAYLLYGENPPKDIYMLQNFMDNNFFKLNYQRLSSAAFLVILGLTVFIILFLRFQERVRVK